MSDTLVFAAEPEPPPASDASHPWLVLVVDDDAEVQAVTRLMMADAHFEGRPLQPLFASSAREARQLLASHPDIAVALVDVVMESDHAGLELIRYIRETLGNRAIRLLLRTGQPGLMPVHEVVSDYAVDDYLLKSELSFQRLRTLLTTTLRTYSLLHRLEDSEARLQQANRELQQLAYTDPLTGLLNRRLFYFQIEREWRRAMREHRPLSAIMLDIDHFKAYNDRYGHLEGDRVLKAVAQTLQAHLNRADDTLCRFGGEEFLALVAGRDLDEGCTLARQLAEAVFALGIEHADSPHGCVSISLGCATIHLGPETPTQGHDQLIQAADAALYRAKRAGRNRVECQQGLGV